MGGGTGALVRPKLPDRQDKDASDRLRLRIRLAATKSGGPASPHPDVCWRFARSLEVIPGDLSNRTWYDPAAVAIIQDKLRALRLIRLL